jgi:hypothetical protein
MEQLCVPDAQSVVQPRHRLDQLPNVALLDVVLVVVLVVDDGLSLSDGCLAARPLLL